MDLVDDLLPVLLLGFGGVVLLNALKGPAQDVAQAAQQAGQNAADIANYGGQVAGAGLSGSWSHTNTSAPSGDQFNFNAADCTVTVGLGTGNVRGHLGFGHVGPGGDFLLTLSLRHEGFLGAGLTDWQQVWSTQFHANGDGDWTGYRFDPSADSVAVTITWATLPVFGDWSVQFSTQVWDLGMTTEYAEQVGRTAPGVGV